MRHQVQSIAIEIEGNEDQTNVTRIYDMGTLTDQITILNNWIEYEGIDNAKNIIRNNVLLPIIDNNISYYDYVIDIESWINYPYKEKLLKIALESHLIGFDDYPTQEDYENGLDELRIKEQGQ